MNTIIQLPESVIAKISAGEVIERPAYAVKELIENSIDAGASVIKISIEDAGLKRICIEDNGEGMSREDLELSFLPHTTSKLQDEHGLIGVKTLGFRGEALSSIAAISTLTIRTRRHNQPGGYEVVVRNSNGGNLSPIGTPPGTVVIVDNLFANVPARKKFLKSEKTEFRLITEVSSQFALSYPHIHFLLTHNKKTVLDLPPKPDLLERMKLLLGISLFEHLIPVGLEDGYIKLTGFIGKPQIASRQNQKQYLFVNNRHVTDRMISLAVRESFGTLLPSSNTPVFLLLLTISPELVDVNVHPRKEQIAFINPKMIFDAVKQAVSTSLTEHNLTFKLARFKTETSARLGETTSFSGRLLKETVLPWNRGEIGDLKPSSQLLQIHQTYILSQIKEGIVLIDQHAAHERILYENFIQAFAREKEKAKIYELPKPLSLNLSPTETQLLDEFAQTFTSLGFIFDHFQGNSFVVRNAPIIFKGRNLEKIIRDILSDLENETVKDVDARSQRMLAFLSCRAAVKAGDILNDKQMQDIVKQLEITASNETCPHGRPTKIQINIEELNKLFRR